MPSTSWNAAVHAVTHTRLLTGPQRARALRRFVRHVGTGTKVRHGVDVWGPELHVGDDVFINLGVVLNNTAEVVLEDRVALGPRVLITTTGHEIGPAERRQGPLDLRPVRVCAGTWVGAGAVVLPGVTIGQGCVVGAGAVVTRDCAPHGLYVGVPARRLRDLP